MNPAASAEEVDPTLLPAFSLRNRLGRALWNLCWALFYRTLASPLPRLAGAAASALRRKTRAGLPLLSPIENLGALEPRLRRPGDSRRRRRTLQPIAFLPGVALHHLPGRIPVRGDPRIQSARLSPGLVPDESRRLRLDMRPRDRPSPRQCRASGRCSAWGRSPRVIWSLSASTPEYPPPKLKSACAPPSPNHTVASVGKDHRADSTGKRSEANAGLYRKPDLTKLTGSARRVPRF